MSSFLINKRPPVAVEGVEPLFLSTTEMRDYLGSNGVMLATEEVFQKQEEIVGRIETWLQFSPTFSHYIETIKTSQCGSVRLSNYPVQEIEEVSVAYGISIPQPQNWQVTHGWWFGDQYIHGLSALTLVRVKYKAGFNPLPQRFISALKSVMLTLYQKFNGDVSQLNNPVSDVKSLSLPGGVSQTFVVGERDSSSRNAVNHKTILDRLLHDLLPDKRSLLF